MAYIGRPLNAGNLAVQSGTGDGSDTTPIATLNYATTTNGIAVYLDGVRQLAGTDYNVTNQTTLTFTTAPANGVGVDVYFLGLEVSIPTPADSSISTAKIVDNAVTLAKMAGGTDGQIITYDASGDPVAVGPGTDGQVLTSTGAGSPPAFEDAGGGAWAVKTSGTFSSASELAITSLTKTTQIWLTDVTGSGGALIYLQTSSNGGSSYDSGGSDYENITHYMNSGGTHAVAASTGAAFIDVGQGGIASTSTTDSTTIITIGNPADSAKYTGIGGRAYQGSDAPHHDLFVGARKAAAIVNAVRLYPSSGNFTGSYVVLELN